MKLIKRIKWIVGAFVVVVVVLVVVVFLWIDHLAKMGIEKGSTYALGVDTTVDSVDIGILAGRSELSGLTVSNPKGFQTSHFLSLGNGVLPRTPSSSCLI